ncbi:MAG TPA: ATP-binding protein [Candidatus Polarisedimenticolaceae bacterium]|nr:ATP-binding protein [Candidatus Polarisedimenticolaceae bacterium]
MTLPSALVGLLAVIVAVAAAGAMALLFAARRGSRRETQEIVRVLEEMRGGRPRGRLEIEPRSPYAPIADAANRLGQDLSVRWARTEAAGEAYHALQDAATGYGVVATDADGDLRIVSPGAVSLFGWEEEALVGRNVAMLFDEASWKDVLPKLARRSLRERGIESRGVMVRKDGTRFSARLTIRLLRGPSDDHPGFLVVVQDVSDQDRETTGKHRDEERAQDILEKLPGGVGVVQGGRIVSGNGALRALLEIESGELPGFALRDRVATGDVLVVQDALSAIERGDGPPRFEGTLRLRDAAGREGPKVSWLAIAHRHEGRAGALVVFRDETALGRAQGAVAAQEARLATILDTIDEAVVLVEDGPGGPRVRFANPAFAHLFGLAASSAAGATEGDLLRTLRDRGELGAAAAACLAAAEATTVEDVVTAGTRTVALAARPLGGPDGPVTGRLLLARDVTAQSARDAERARDTASLRRRLEAAETAQAKLRALHDDLASRRAEAERLNQELQRLDTMKSDLLANVSHELQTPLVSIRGYTEMILKGRLGPINDEQKQGLSLSLRNIDRLIAMIDNLLAFARMDRDGGAIDLRVFPPAAVADEALALLREKIEAKELRVTRTAADPALLVRADRDKILQVFVNLLSNAVKFNRDRGSIAIEFARGKPGFALVHVKDTGSGIAREDLEKIFDRFYQAGSRAGEGGKEGTGIGLAIVRNILRLHGCVIHATSTPGEGTIFSFTLPIAAEREAEPPRPVAVPDPEPPVAEDPPAHEAPERPRLRIIRR